MIVRSGSGMLEFHDPIETARFSRDGRYIVTKVSRDGLECAYVSDVRSPDLATVFETKFAMEVKVSNDGRFICVAGGLRAGIYDLLSVPPQFIGFKDCSTSWFRFSADDRYLAARIDRNLRHFGIWDLQQRPPQKVVDTPGSPMFLGNKIVKILLSTSRDESHEHVEFINVTVNEPDPVKLVLPLDKKVMVLSEDERILCYFKEFLVAYDMSKSVPRVLDLTTGTQRLYPIDVGISPDSSYLWTLMRHGEPLRFWDLRTDPPKALDSNWPAGPIKDVVFSKNGRFMVARPFGRLQNGARPHTLENGAGHTAPGSSDEVGGGDLQIHNEQASRRNGRISPVDSILDQPTLGEIWDLSVDTPNSQPRLISRTPLSMPPRDGVSEALDKLHDVLLFSPNEHFLASITGGAVDLWNLMTGEHWELKNDLGYYCTGGTFSPDSHYFETEHGVDFRKRDIWDLRSASGPVLLSLVRPGTGRRSRWSSSSFSGSGRYLFTRTFDKRAANEGHAIWDLSTKECIIVNDDYNCSGRSSPDGRFLLEFNGKRLEIIDLLMRSRRKSSVGECALLDEE
jgi:hypothetical protein